MVNDINATVQWYRDLGDSLQVWIYCYFFPIFFVVAVVERLLSLMTFRIQAKAESAYLFQIFVAIIEALEATALSFYVGTRYVWPNYGHQWFNKCYICVAYDAHFSNTINFSLNLCSLLLSLCMTLDRLYALAKPMKYSSIKNHKRNHSIVLVVVICFSFLASMPDAFLFDVRYVEDKQIYKLVGNQWWNTILMWFNVHTWFRLVIALCLTTSAIALGIVYKHRMKNRAKFLKNRSPQESAAELKKATTLFWLAVIQSSLIVVAVILDTVSQLLDVANLLDINLDSNVIVCMCAILGPLTDAAKALANMLHFYFAFALVPSFRRMIISAVKETFKSGTPFQPQPFQPQPF